MRDAGACGGAAAASPSPLASTDLRLHGCCTGLVNVIRVPRATILWDEGDERNQSSCPPNAHSKLQKPPHVPASPRHGGRRNWRKIRRERCAAAMPPCSCEPPEAARPPGQRTGGFCQLV